MLIDRDGPGDRGKARQLDTDAIAMLALGRSWREAQAELRERFPDADIPHYSTIARWLREPLTPKSRGVQAYWMFVYERAGSLLLRYMDKEGHRLSLMELLTVSSKATDVCLKMTQVRALKKMSGSRI